MSSQFWDKIFQRKYKVNVLWGLFSMSADRLSYLDTLNTEWRTGRINPSDWLVCQRSLCASLFKRTSSCLHQLDVIQALILIFIYCLRKECNTWVLRHSCGHTCLCVSLISFSHVVSRDWNHVALLYRRYFFLLSYVPIPRLHMCKILQTYFNFPQGSTLGALIILGMVLIMF